MPARKKARGKSSPRPSGGTPRGHGKHGVRCLHGKKREGKVARDQAVERRAVTGSTECDACTEKKREGRAARAQAAERRAVTGSTECDACTEKKREGRVARDQAAERRAVTGSTECDACTEKKREGRGLVKSSFWRRRKT